MAEKITVGIDGMTCGHCVSTITTALKSVRGVETVDVQLKNKQAVLEYSTEQQPVVDSVTKLLEEMGYDVSWPA